PSEPCHAREGARPPESDRHRVVDIGPGDQVGVDRAEHRRDPDPDDDESEPLDALSIGQHVDHRGGEEPTEDRCRGDRPVVAGSDDQDGHHHRGVGAGVEADHVRGAERVARQGLEDRSSDPEEGAEGDCGDGDRKSPLQSDDPVETLAATAENPQYLADRQGVVADGERDDRQPQGEGDEHRRDRQETNADTARDAAEPEGAGGVPEVEVRTLGGGLRGVPLGRGHKPLAFRRRSRAISTGAPITAVTRPTSISPGRAITLPTTSAASTRTGAASAEYRMIQRWSGPVNHRTICGTISPTKPMPPVRAVAPPASSVTARIPSSLVRCTRVPRDAAKSSPRARALSVPVSASAITSPAMMNGATVSVSAGSARAI